MAKTILKEIIIILLLCLAIILILGVLLYGYIPSNKVIPEVISYTAPDNIKEELAQTVTGDDLEVILTYEINANDLKNAQKVNTYNPGKPNPFASYEQASTSTSDSADSSTSNSSTSANSSTSTNNGTSNNSGYSIDKGTK